ncbi:hypothetical protein Y032_0006g2994 [Ancylostoma ceylanicum]|uniref:Oxidoreductase, short chain dehydrogenase/reductase family protein n=1 Tax=Ancylostoma ceylanicum TaxID=53326 RepID=A0A016VRT0_9BILA|nr:hypothetical protein Y032_0006g2994 [Ancylostoma ceylanicum]
MLLDIFHQLLRHSKISVVISPTDLAAENAPKTIVHNTLGKFQRIDSLVNSAGILRAGPVLDSDISVYDELFNVNVRCLVRLTREALPHIIKSKGTVVNVSSINGPCPFPGVTYYCMSKSAVDQFTKCLALEMAPHGVRVNAVKVALRDIFFNTFIDSSEGGTASHLR